MYKVYPVVADLFTFVRVGRCFRWFGELWILGDAHAEVVDVVADEERRRRVILEQRRATDAFYKFKCLSTGHFLKRQKHQQNDQLKAILKTTLRALARKTMKIYVQVKCNSG